MKNELNAAFSPEGALFNRVDPRSKKPIPGKKNKKQFVPNANLIGILFNLLKWLLMGSCFLACGYQAYQFLEIFVQYETITVTEMKYQEFVDLPAITACNTNGIRRTEFCNLHKDRCQNVENQTEFCENYGMTCKYLNSTEMVFPKVEEYSKEGKLSYNDYRSIGHQPSSLFISCQYLADSTYEQCSFYTWYPAKDKENNKKICYRINVEKDASYSTQPKINMKKSSTKKQPALKWFINLDPSESFRPDREPEALVTVHSPYHFVDPFKEGFSVKPGTLYKLSMTVIEMFLLPSPYDSNCTNYIGRWNANNGRGPVSQELCFDICYLNLMLKECNCVSESIQMPHDKRLCETEDERKCVKETSYVSCQDFCGQPCYAFEYTFNIRKKPGTSLSSSTDSRRRDWAQIEVYFKSQELLSYSYEPKYEYIELFSYVGGFLSMWLGMSLLTLADVIGASFTIAKLLCRGKPKKQTEIFTISKMVGRKAGYNESL